MGFGHQPVDLAGAHVEHAAAKLRRLERAQKVQRADDVDLERGLRVAKRFRHGALRGEMDHRIGSLLRDELRHRAFLAQIERRRDVGERPALAVRRRF